jgi:NAD(P)H-hydrate epimerase
VILVTAAEMRALDRWTIEHGTPGHVLMERAGAGATRVLRRRLGRLRGPVVILAGRGNNGGDGFVVARRLRRARIPAEVWLTAPAADVRGDAARMLAAWQRAGGRLHPLTGDAGLRAFTERLARAGAIVDALYGTGLNAPVRGSAGAAIEAINAAGKPVLAIDVPSGLSADTGQPLGVAVRATATATFAFAKVGHVIHPGAELSGMLEVVDIGIAAGALLAHPPTTRLLEVAEVGRLLPVRARAAHKGTFGHVLVIAGSRGKSGAALMAAEGAARAGAGLTTLAGPASLQSVFEGQVREVMTEALPDGPDGAMSLGDGQALAASLRGRNAVVCGPGLGVTDGTRALVAALVREARVPLVLDADGLNALAGTPLLRGRPAATIITPHPGEMARLIGGSTADVQRDRVAAARRVAAEEGVIVALKGARTVIAAPDGRAAISPTGNPGMASGGMGDVLCGMIGGLLAQGLDPFAATALAVFAHGAAADTVAELRGEVGLLARDVLREIPPTLARLQREARHPGRRGQRAP